jgi:hypothetical protein
MPANSGLTLMDGIRATLGPVAEAKAEYRNMTDSDFQSMIRSAVPAPSSQVILRVPTTNIAHPWEQSCS